MVKLQRWGQSSVNLNALYYSYFELFAQNPEKLNFVICLTCYVCTFINTICFVMGFSRTRLMKQTLYNILVKLLITFSGSPQTFVSLRDVGFIIYPCSHVASLSKYLALNERPDFARGRCNKLFYCMSRLRILLQNLIT